MAKAKMLMWPLSIVAATYLAVKAYGVKNAVQNLTASNPKISKIKIHPLSIDLQITMDEYNQNSQSIPFEYYYGDIYYQGKVISNFTFDGKGKNIVFPGRATIPVPFALTIKSFNIVTELISVFAAIKGKKKIDSVFEIKSAVYAAGVDIPVNFSYDVASNTTTKKTITPKS